MARRRFAVALLVPQPVAGEIDVLRLALGDRQLGRIGAHITIIPPINLTGDELDDALVVVERAASRTGPIEVMLGPIETFGEDSPVRFLRVDPWTQVVALKEQCWRGPFDRAERRPFHPHVTVDIDGSPSDGVDPAIELLAGYCAETAFDRVTVLEHFHDDVGRRWEPYLASRLAGPTESVVDP